MHIDEKVVLPLQSLCDRIYHQISLKTFSERKHGIKTTRENNNVTSRMESYKVKRK